MPSSPVSEERAPVEARPSEPRRRTTESSWRERSHARRPLQARARRPRQLPQALGAAKSSGGSQSRPSALLRDWLEAVDSVDRALRWTPRARSDGLRSVLEQMEAILARQGVERVGAAGRAIRPRAARGGRGARERRGARPHRASTSRARAIARRRPGAAPGAGGRVADAAPREAGERRGLMAVGFRDYYEVLGVPRGASAEEIRAPTASSPASTTRTSTRSPAPRTASRRSPRPTRSCATPRSGSATTASGRTGKPARTSRRLRVRRRLRRLRGGDGGPLDSATGRLQRLLRGPVRRPWRGALAGGFDGFSMRGSDQEATLELTLEEAAGGGKQRISLADGRDFEVHDPAGRARRPANPPRRRGRGRGERRPGGGPLPAGADQTPPALPRRGRRPRASSSRSRPGRRRSAATVDVPTLNGRRQGQSPGRLLQRPPSAAEGRGDAGPGWTQRATSTQASRSSSRRSSRSASASCSRSWPRSPGSTRGRGADVTRHGARPCRRRALARRSGLHPDLVRRLIALDAVDPLDLDAAARLARLARLRRDLGLNVAGAALACDLLERIEELEARRR